MKPGTSISVNLQRRLHFLHATSGGRRTVSRQASLGRILICIKLECEEASNMCRASHQTRSRAQVPISGQASGPGLLTGISPHPSLLLSPLVHPPYTVCECVCVFVVSLRLCGSFISSLHSFLSCPGSIPSLSPVPFSLLTVL